jgi:hypothetical protein
MDGKPFMSEFTSDDQWRSFQTFVAAYLAGMLHPRDVFTISKLVDDALGAIGQTGRVVGADCHTNGTAATLPNHSWVCSALADLGRLQRAQPSLTA